MDHGYMLTLSIHLAEIPTSAQNFANTVGQNPALILTLCPIEAEVKMTLWCFS